MNSTAPAPAATLTASRSFAAPAMARDHGVPSATFSVTVTTDRGHFSVTGELRTSDRRYRDPVLSCGCMHDDAARLWPTIKPLIALHLSDALTGEPMHAEANGFYWLAGALADFGALGEQYHGGNSNPARSFGECYAILADHLRIAPEEAHAIGAAVLAAYELPRDPDELPKLSNIRARNVFHDFITAQRDRWESEAASGRALIAMLANG